MALAATTWFWTGEALEGAVIVSRLALPFAGQKEPVAIDTHVAWLGGDGAQWRRVVPAAST